MSQKIFNLLLGYPKPILNVSFYLSRPPLTTIPSATTNLLTSSLCPRSILVVAALMPPCFTLGWHQIVFPHETQSASRSSATRGIMLLLCAVTMAWVQSPRRQFSPRRTRSRAPYITSNKNKFIRSYVRQFVHSSVC